MDRLSGGNEGEGEGPRGPFLFVMRLDMFELLGLDNQIEEFWKMAGMQDKLTQEEMSDLVACVDGAIQAAERSGARKDVLPGVAKAYLQRAEVLKLLRSKVVMK